MHDIDFCSICISVYPHEVSNLKATANDHKSITINWKAPPDIGNPDYGTFKCYIIYIELNIEMIDTKWHCSTYTSRRIHYLSSNTWYGIQVQVVTHQGYGKLSEQVFVKTQSESKRFPKATFHVAVSAGSVLLDFSKKQGFICGICRREERFLTKCFI